MTPKGSKLDLRSILVDGGPAKNCLGLQKENVGVEEARQVLDEIDFSLKSCKADYHDSRISIKKIQLF